MVRLRSHSKRVLVRQKHILARFYAFLKKKSKFSFFSKICKNPGPLEHPAPNFFFYKTQNNEGPNI